MSSKPILTALCALGLGLSAPVAAQETSDPFAEMLQVEPLTEEQEARMPTARRLLELVVPEGAFGEMMGGMMGGFIGSAGVAQAPDPVTGVSEALGYQYYNEDLDEAKAARALEIIHPAWRQRSEVEASFVQDFVGQMFAPLEPVMREAMAELYAIYFTEQQLLDIETFYNTETGQAFARESYAMMSDPRLFAAMMSQPDMFENMEEPDTSAMEEALAALPERRAFDDLSERERALVSALLGISEQELREYMEEPDISAMEVMEAAEEAAEAMEEAGEEID